jgi:adenine-specific DNA-methyltransferase
MAAIEDLIKNIADPRLREQIAAEVAKLKTGKKFGLVFEEHLPELVRLPSLPIKVGVRVLKKDDKTANTFRVVAEVNGKKVRIVPDAGGPEEVVERASVVVAKAFGEPIYPALVPVDAVERAPGKPWHVLINADNYHALQLFLYGYEGKVDVIYIDPPYNTGARDWKYNNDYVDDTDQYRHSKWLSMMKKRLVLAKRLLTRDGVLIVTIDEHEVHRLACLLEELLPESRLQMVTIVNNAAGVTQGGFYRVEEYAFFAFLGGSRPCELQDDFLMEESKKTSASVWFSMIRYGGVNSLPSKRPNLVYPIAIDPERCRIVGTGKTLKERMEQWTPSERPTGSLDHWRPDRSEKLKGHPVVWPFRGNGASWRPWNPDLFEFARRATARAETRFQFLT